MNCDILKIVRGNDFATQMTITALDAGGNVIEDFSLEDSTDVVVKYTLAGESHTIEAYDYDIEGNDITIQWSDLALGKYGFEIEGKFNGYSWRSAARFIFQIVADNASANIPDGVLVNGIYILNDWLRLLSGTGGGIKQVQADWTETDTEAPSYIQHKPELAPVATSGSYNDLTNKPTIPDVSGKADKVSGAVIGDFAALDANGNLTDSGKKASDFATAAQGAKADTAIQDISGKQDVLVSGTNIKTINNESILGSGNITIEGGGGDVESVNGQTGVVVLDAEDVGAASAEDLQDVVDDVAANTQDIATLQAAYAGLTQSDIVIGALPSSGVANTIYRVPSTSSYSDYMWDGSQFVLMATYDNAIDDVPTVGSNNLVKSGGVKDALLVYEKGVIDTSIYTEINYAIGSNGKWGTAGNGKFIPITPNHTYKITARITDGSGCICGFLKTNTYKSNQNADFATGCSVIIILDGETFSQSAPSDALYLFVRTYRNTGSVDTTPTVTELGMDVNDAVDGIEKDIYGNIGCNQFCHFTTGKSINYSTGIVDNGGWKATTDYVVIPPDADILEYERMIITNTTSTAGVAFYNASGTYISGIPSIFGAPAYSSYRYRCKIPLGAKYFKATYYRDSNIAELGLKDFSLLFYNSNAYSIISRLSSLENDAMLLNAKTLLGLHTVPESTGVLNAIKRCRQMTDIEWTPTVDLPRLGFETLTPPDDFMETYYQDRFLAGKKYRGIPYGRCVTYKQGYGYDNTYVGMTIGFDTFITAVMNADSMVCKESVFDLSDHRSIPYAAVCSSLVCYALGLTTYYPTGSIPQIPGLSLVSPIVVNNERIDLNILKLGDVINNTGVHTAMVTDIVKENGSVAFVEVCEATPAGNGNRAIIGSEQGGVCRRIGFSVEDFFWYFKGYSILRYQYIANIPYTISPYVKIGDEVNQDKILEFPVMPYEGYGFRYKASNTSNVKLIISCSDYSYLRVFKGENEISGSPFAISPSDTEKTISEVSVGDYSAYLCNMSGSSNTAMTGR